MAWRRLASVLGNLGVRDSERIREAATRAYEFRDRLTERERLHVVSSYHRLVAGDPVQAARTLLETARGRLGAAEEHLRQAVASDSTQAIPALELLAATDSWIRRDLESAARWLERAREEQPFARHAPAEWPAWLEAMVTMRAGRAAEFEALLPRLREEESSSSGSLPDMGIERLRGHLAWATGDFNGAAAHYEEAGRLEACSVCYLSPLAAVHHEAGRTETALPLLERSLAPGVLNLPNALLVTQAFERVARIHEELGNREAALDAWSTFAERWRDADPELQPRVEYARERIAALGG